MTHFDREMETAKVEAQRFLSRIHKFEVHLQVEAQQHDGHYACSQRAAVRRASLDLTRALSRLRDR